MDYYSLRGKTTPNGRCWTHVQEMQKAVDLTTNRFRGGLTSELEVKQAQTLLNQTKAQAQALDVQRSQLEHAIAVLIGKARRTSRLQGVHCRTVRAPGCRR